MSEDQKARRASLADVAERAGVSISTVSKVVNGRSDVAVGTRQRVEEVLRDYNYVAPRDRHGSDHVSVTLLTRSMTSPYTLEIIRGAVAAAENADADLVIAVYRDQAEDLAWIDSMSRRGCHAVIAVTSVLDDRQVQRFANVGLPLVIIDPLNIPAPGVQSVGATNWNGGLAATEHLLKLGHTRIGLLMGVKTALASRAREHGYVAALSAAGIEIDPLLILEGDYTFTSGIETGIRLLTSPNPPTAIFAASDFQALGVIEAARQLGLRVPQDVSIVGFDDIVIAASSSPPLTTIRQPLVEMGEMSMKIALGMAAGVTPATHHTELATSLTLRASTSTNTPNERRDSGH